MCGILGIFGECSLLSAKSLLQLLTHRGQDASGLLWTTPRSPNNNDDNDDDNGWTMHTTKTIGHPLRIQTDDDISSRFILGSTRYPTFGSRSNTMNLERFAQPFIKQVNGHQLGLVHNGNITNTRELSNKEFESDSELITELLAERLAKHNGDIPTAVHELMEMLDGSYANACVFNGQMFAYRDPLGLRPVVVGTDPGIAIIASESVVHSFVGMHEFKDVKPGELILLEEEDLK